MSTKLNQIIAVEKTVKSSAGAELNTLYHTLQKKDLINGLTRTYEKRNEDDADLPSEVALPQVRIPEVLEQISEQWTRMLDVVATKDWGNTQARADVKIDDEVIIPQAPVTYLLWLEKQLVDLNTVVSKIPTLDPTVSWSYDSTAGYYKSDVQVTTKTKKVPRNHVKAEATDKHPAQVDVFTEDVVVGYWHSIKFSGALPVERVRTLVDRIVSLQTAVKSAREEANSIEVEQTKVGKAIFEYLLAE